MTQASVDHEPMSRALRAEPSSVVAHRTAVASPPTIAITERQVSPIAKGSGGRSARWLQTGRLWYHAAPRRHPSRAAPRIIPFLRGSPLGQDAPHLDGRTH